ncbi:MAG TPA: hypothetical protein VN673_12375, partial [Clostridia bacterium]|nr:hypothetical protein [Clostridia bacterium]
LADIGAFELGHLISGIVTTNGSTGLAGVTIAADSASTLTTASGTYAVYVSTAEVTVTPSLAGYEFFPRSRALTIASNATGVNFVARPLFSLGGRVLEGTNVINGVLLTLTSPVTTNSAVTTNGFYLFSGVHSNVYSIVPSLAGYRFDPPSRIVTTNINNTNLNFALIPRLGIGMGTNGFQIAFGGSTGTVYRIEASTNLATWQILSTNTTPFSFTDAEATNFHSRYYRLRRD